MKKIKISTTKPGPDYISIDVGYSLSQAKDTAKGYVEIGASAVLIYKSKSSRYYELYIKKKEAKNF